MESINHLACFVAVVRSGSFAAAAAGLGVTPPAVSKSIARLERELGVRLFNRTTRQIRLTGEGRGFYEKVGVLMSGIDEAVDDVRSNARELRGRIRVSVGATFGRHCLLPAIAEFLLLYPNIELECAFEDRPRSPVEQGFDVEIRHGQGRETSQVSRPLCPYPIVLLASPAYLARRGVPRSPAELAAHDCIGIRLPSGTVASWRLVRRSGKGPPHQYLPRTRFTVAAQFDASLDAALEGIGIAPSALPVVWPHLREGRLKVVLPDYRIDSAEPGGGRIFVQYPHRQYLAPRVRAFVDYLLQRFAASAEQYRDWAPFAA